MGKKDKKKGKGAEKTAMKTEKKALSKIQKDLAAKGEDDIEKLISEFQEADKSRSFVGEEPSPQPSPRSGFSLCAHPDKEELVLYGGEYYNGSKTVMYSDIYFYNIKKGTWTLFQTPEKPPPRCSHQAVCVSQRGGQMFVFGGEFASPTRSNFYHYRDLWVFHFSEKRWEQLKARGGPSARSGHRMAVSKKNVVVFGGFNESVRDYKYFNDLHIFNLESYTWSKMEPVGKVPSPRSGCLVAPLVDGRVLVYGGYSREKMKKDVDKGIPHTDMFYLHVDERVSPPKWKWVQSKAGGLPPSARSGMTLAVAPNANTGFAFGGVHDEETDEENMEGVFHNDLYTLDLETGRWQPIALKGVKGASKKKRRRAEGGEEEEDESEEVVEAMEMAAISEEAAEKTVCDDGIFTVKIGPSSSTAPMDQQQDVTMDTSEVPFTPPARMGGALVVKNGVLYLYGGLCEDGDRQYTLSDFYALDVRKLDTWRTIVPCTDLAQQEWVDSSSSSESSEGSESDEDMDAQ